MGPVTSGIGFNDMTGEFIRDELLQRKPSAAKPVPEPRPEQCRCVLPQLPRYIRLAACPRDFDREDFLCASCRDLHKPLFDEDWHTG